MTSHAIISNCIPKSLHATGLLVEEFSDIISLHNSDLGQTGLVKHTINTGDTSPIK